MTAYSCARLRPDPFPGDITGNPARSFTASRRLVSRRRFVLERVEQGAAPVKLFVCYSHKDQADLDVLLESLRPLEREGLVEAWNDRRIDVGAKWRDVIQEAIDGCDVGIFLVTRSFRASDFIESEEKAQLLTRQAEGKIDLIPILLRECMLTGSGLEHLQPLPDWQDFLHREERSDAGEDRCWKKITETLRAKAEKYRPASGRVRMPYPGMNAFELDDADLFMAREAESTILADRLAGDRHMLVLVGDSGSGKSSLAKAGIVPRLLRRPGIVLERVLITTPNGMGDGDPFRALASVLSPCWTASTPTPGELARALEAEPASVSAYVDKALRGRAVDAELVIVLDQFEELFTLVDEEPRREAFAQVVDALAGHERVRVLLTLRSDFYGRFVQQACFERYAADAVRPVKAVGLDRFREIIERPAALAGFSFEEGLVDRLIDDAATLREAGGVVPLLSYTLRAFVEPLRERIEAEKPLAPSELCLSHARYEEFGKLEGAIERAAERAVEGLGDVQPLVDRLAAKIVRVTSDKSVAKRALPRREYSADPALAELVERLVRHRLLVATDTAVEVAHEALFRAWPAMRDWITQHKDDLNQFARLEQDALHWAEQGRPRTLLWAHERQEPLHDAVVRLGEEVDGLPEPLRTFARPEAQRLLDEIEDAATDHERRDWIGRRWCEIGDPRAGVGLREDGLPDIVWCNIPGGVVRLKDNASTSDEVKPFRLAKYSLTRSQYHPFLERPDGYANDRWWEGLERPTPPVPPFGAGASYPVGLVSWHEAMAYCRWLTACYREAGLIELGQDIRLPTEFEWQQAACGGDAQREYPWRGEFDSARCNTVESKLMRTTAVGLYPRGKTEQGVYDMAGNSWEWCLNRTDDPKGPVFAGDAKALRALRGGSLIDLPDYAAVAFRLRDLPGCRNVNLGFRVSCGSPIVDS